MRPFGKKWDRVARNENVWQEMRLRGKKRNHLARNETTWQEMRPCGKEWDRVARNETAWQEMRPCGQKLEPLWICFHRISELIGIWWDAMKSTHVLRLAYLFSYAELRCQCTIGVLAWLPKQDVGESCFGAQTTGLSSNTISPTYNQQNLNFLALLGNYGK